LSKEIKSHLTGTVWKIEVALGESVEEDEDYIILESMKMEMPISAESNCVIKDILVTEGEAVEEGQVLLIVDDT
tara:strand:+ start:191 stop:412 length:222 start_codon:yes stop_codon:yes gene_type:complete